ncbi:MAG TPA: ATP-binding protein [Longimicrobiaceae bacterium]|nr:ATP-binding protein [Longimicrobiaceae bacterium]
MRIATRLILVLSLVFAAIMVAYALLTQRQREHLIGNGLIRETEVLAHTLQVVTNNALRDRRFADLDQVLGLLTQDPETFVAVVTDAEGQVLAGGRERDMACLRGVIREQEPTAGDPSGWAKCGEWVRWVVLPVREPASLLVVARYATVMEHDIAASRERHLLLALALAVAATLAVILVLNRTLRAPLAEIMRGVRSLSGEGTPAPIRVSPAAGELGSLAVAFNEMAAQLEARRRSLLRETEERLALERRLLGAEKYALLGRLTGGLAHELGSPLNVIGVRAEAILAHPDAPAAVRHQGEQILAEVDRIAQLVRGLLHVARRHGIDARPVDLTEVVRSAFAHLHKYAEPAEVQLQLELPAEPVVIRGEQMLLRHALLNLARNAVQALAAHAGERRLRIALEPDTDHVRVVVQDTGPGIAPEHCEQIFDPFFTTKDVGEGTGLGLSISRGIAEEHGGTLQLETAQGGGVRAVLSLPVDGPRAEASKEVSE